MSPGVVEDEVMLKKQAMRDEDVDPHEPQAQEPREALGAQVGLREPSPSPPGPHDA